MSQLDRIEAMLTELLELNRNAAVRDATASLSSQMAEAVALTKKIAAQQALDAAVTDQIPEDDPGVSREPIVQKPESKDGKPLPFVQPKPEAEHRPDQTGGVPAVKAGKSDPASPKNWAGVPKWEEGRRPVEIVPGRK